MLRSGADCGRIPPPELPWGQAELLLADLSTCVTILLAPLVATGCLLLSPSLSGSHVRLGFRGLWPNSDQYETSHPSEQLSLSQKTIKCELKK